MIYLLRPGRPLVWNDIPWKVALEADQHDADLTRLDWSGDTDQTLDDCKIRVALRHGIRCEGGIIVEGLTLRASGDGDNLRTISMQASEAHQALRDYDDLMESLSPGWRAHGEALDARITAYSEKEARRRDAKARALLGAPPKPELVKHWEALGGYVPDPI